MSFVAELLLQNVHIYAALPHSLPAPPVIEPLGQCLPNRDIIQTCSHTVVRQCYPNAKSFHVNA